MLRSRGVAPGGSSSSGTHPRSRKPTGVPARRSGGPSELGCCVRFPFFQGSLGTRPMVAPEKLGSSFFEPFALTPSERTAPVALPLG